MPKELQLGPSPSHLSGFKSYTIERVYGAVVQSTDCGAGITRIRVDEDLATLADPEKKPLLVGWAVCNNGLRVTIYSHNERYLKTAVRYLPSCGTATKGGPEPAERKVYLDSNGKRVRGPSKAAKIMRDLHVYDITEEIASCGAPLGVVEAP